MQDVPFAQSIHSARKMLRCNAFGKELEIISKENLRPFYGCKSIARLTIDLIMTVMIFSGLSMQHKKTDTFLKTVRAGNSNKV